MLYYDSNLGSPATPRPAGGGVGDDGLVFASGLPVPEDLFPAGQAGTARKAGRASTGGLKVQVGMGGGGGCTSLLPDGRIQGRWTQKRPSKAV